MKYFFVLIAFVLSVAASAKDVRFAFQQATDKDRMFFIKSQNENKNVLYINEKCLNCFKSLAQIKKELVNGQFIIVSATNNINFLKKIAQQNAPSVMNLVYYDPGRRFEKKLGLENINSSYVLFKKNSFKKIESNAQTVSAPAYK